MVKLPPLLCDCPNAETCQTAVKWAGVTWSNFYATSFKINFLFFVCLFAIVSIKRISVFY